MTEHLDPQSGQRQPQDTALGGDQEVGSNSMPPEPTTVRFDDETRRWLEEEAKRQGVSVSEIVRHAAAFYKVARTLESWLAAQRDRRPSGE